MAQAFVLIEAVPKKARAACARIGRIPGVEAAHLITGPYDIIALVHAADPHAIGTVVMNKIQAVDGVGKTVTCVVL
jgi:DNA-binding Lrp family transcriptional regulator